jgi:nuclear pore complex protein Nup54
MEGGDKRPAPPNSPDLTPSKINPNHPAALGISGSSKKKPPALEGFGASTTDGTGSFFGGQITSNPGTVETMSSGGFGTPASSTGLGDASGRVFGTPQTGTSAFGLGTPQGQIGATGLGGSAFGTPAQNTNLGGSGWGGSAFGGSPFGGTGSQGTGFGGQPQFSQSAFQPQQSQQPQQPIPQLQPGHQSLSPAFSSSITSHALPSKPSMFADFGTSLRGKSSDPTPGPSNQNYGPAQPPSIPNQLSTLKQKWDPSSPECIFQTYFYNRVGTDQAALYTKPPNQDQKKWDEAVTARPDNSVVPVLAVGFPALKERRQLQEQQVLTYRARMHEIVGKISELQKAHDLTTAPKIDSARDKLITLSHRTLRLAAKVQVLKSRGYALRPEEEVLKERLVRLERELKDPGSFGRVGEIWARLGAVKQRLMLLNQVDNTKIDWSDESTTEMVAKVPPIVSKLREILSDQASGMNYLAELLKKELEEANALLEKVQERKKRTQFPDRSRRNR